MSVGPHGLHPRPYQGPSTDACNVLASRTDASFTGGSYILEQGMVDTECAAVTYAVPASEFPIKINLTETIVGQQASVSTTTQWSILYYSGTPTTGVLVSENVADDVILPFIRIPAGTNGVNVQFSVDPQDADQIIINDDGSHTFTVVFRIDHLNSPPGNPCTQAPSPSLNAFLAVDTSGLSSAANNWLKGINCGPFGCPANGGWATFAGLASFCRPSDDWVMRTTWSSVPNCTPGVGACCLPNGNCSVLTTTDCTAQSGAFQGDSSTCGQVTCTPQVGACCLGNGSCITGVNSTQCVGQGGAYQGNGSACGTCPQPSGACCFSNGNCLVFTSASCTTAGGNWLGAGSVCGSGNTCPYGACCLPSGSCVANVTSIDCGIQGGTFRGVGTNCSTQCPQPTGACCFSSGGCLALTQSDCSTAGGANWAGAFTTCGGNTCTQPCYANCDQSTAPPVLNANDFQCFLNKFAGADSYANCDQSTVAPVLNANDFQCYLNKYAAGCT
jgi:hypothetical protein